MPKPVLSDSLFNADDVATAILNKANLQVANESLATTDISSHFVLSSGWTVYDAHFLKFNGFIFWSGYYFKGSTPANDEVFLTIANQNSCPQTEWRTIATGYQADTGSRIRIMPNGNIMVSDPVHGPGGDPSFYLMVSAFWNINF